MEHYDSIYGDKDYTRDIEVFARFAGLPARSTGQVLEIGPGTGNHTTLLSQVAERVVSVEIDADFVQLLRAKVMRLGLANVEIEQARLEKLEQRRFDAACALFHVLNYIEPTEMPMFIKSLGTCMKPNACFVADLWNYEAVKLDPPKREVRRKPLANAMLSQTIEPYFDVATRTVRIDYRISIEPSEPQVDFCETLRLRMWSRDDLKELFRQAGFRDIGFFAHADTDRAPDERSFRQWLCARKAG